MSLRATPGQRDQFVLCTTCVRSVSAPSGSHMPQGFMPAASASTSRRSSRLLTTAQSARWNIDPLGVATKRPAWPLLLLVAPGPDGGDGALQRRQCVQDRFVLTPLDG
jgi:hypothetical protein